MKTHSVASVVAVLIVLLACNARPEAESADASPLAAPLSPLEGAWRAAEVHAADGSSLIDPPSLYLFTGTHYSIMRVSGPQPRPGFAAPEPTDTEKITAFNTFIANAGTYELVGDSLTIRPIVSKHPNYMGGGFDTYALRQAADTVWLTGNSANLRYVMNGQIVASTEEPGPTMVRLIRVD